MRELLELIGAGGDRLAIGIETIPVQFEIRPELRLAAHRDRQTANQSLFLGEQSEADGGGLGILESEFKLEGIVGWIGPRGQSRVRPRLHLRLLGKGRAAPIFWPPVIRVGRENEILVRDHRSGARGIAPNGLDAQGDGGVGLEASAAEQAFEGVRGNIQQIPGNQGLDRVTLAVGVRGKDRPRLLTSEHDPLFMIQPIIDSEGRLPIWRGTPEGHMADAVVSLSACIGIGRRRIADEVKSERIALRGILRVGFGVGRVDHRRGIDEMRRYIQPLLIVHESDTHGEVGIERRGVDCFKKRVGIPILEVAVNGRLFRSRNDVHRGKPGLLSHGSAWNQRAQADREGGCASERGLSNGFVPDFQEDCFHQWGEAFLGVGIGKDMFR